MHKHQAKIKFSSWLLLAFALPLGLFILALLSNTTHAATCGGVDTSFVACDDQASGGTEVSGIWSLLLIVINILTAGVGVLAVGGFVYAAVMYTTAEDKAEQVNQAKTIMLNVVIGLVAFGLMYSLLQFLVPGGVFNSIGAPRVSTATRDSLPGTDSGPTSGGSSSGTSGGGTTIGTLGEDPIAELTKCTVPVTKNYHAHYTEPGYRAGNSTQGDKRACREGYAKIDHDLQITKDLVVVNTHWGTPNKDDFLPNSDDRTLGNMTWAQVSRLRSPDGYRIRSAYQTMIQTCSLGIKVTFEAKGDRRFERVDVWKKLAGYAKQFCGSNWKDEIRAATICDINGTANANQRMDAARAAGFKAAVWHTC